MKNSLFHTFDFTLGPLADGRTNILVRNLLKEKITVNEFLNDIKPLTLRNSQMALHTEDAINCLKLVRVKEIEME